MAKSLPKGVGPGTDNSQRAHPFRDKVRSVFSMKRDIHLPDPNKKAGISAAKRLMSGASMSKSKR